MKKLRAIILLLIVLIPMISIAMPMVQMYEYMSMAYGDYYYDYYYSGNSKWIFVYLGGGIGYSDRIDGCLGSRNDKGYCNINPKGDEWIAKLFLGNGIDFIEPEKYLFKISDVWPIQLISYLRTRDYNTILFGGFSGGAGAGLSLAASYGRNANWNITVAYAGPSYLFTSGPLASASKASNTYTKVFLAHGTNDTVAPPYDGELYIKNMPSSVEKLLITVGGVGHDTALIPYTLDNLFAFIGKPRPPQYEILTSTIIQTESYTQTQISTTSIVSIVSITATMQATTVTEVITRTKLVETHFPKLDTIINGLIILTWFIVFAFAAWYLRKRLKNGDNKSKSG